MSVRHTAVPSKSSFSDWLELVGMDGNAMVVRAFQDWTDYRIYMNLKKQYFFLKVYDFST